MAAVVTDGTDSADPALDRFNEGAAWLEADRLDEAAAAFAQALDLEPRFVEASFNLAFVRHRQGDHETAASLYRRTLTLAPDHVGAETNLGACLKLLGRREEAVECFRRAVDLRPEDLQPRANLADALRELGRLPEAIEAYRGALAIRADAGMLFTLGCCLLDLDQDEAALAAFQRTTLLKHDFVEAHANRAVALRKLGRFDEALRSCELAIALKPDHLHAHFTEGDVLFDLGLLEQSLASRRRAIEIAPDHPEALNKLGIGLTELDRAGEALDVLNRAIALRPDNAGQVTHLGNAYAKLERFDDALAAYRRSLELDPSGHGTWCNLGIILHDLDCFDDALDCYEQARRLKPDAALQEYNEAATRLLLGQFEIGWRKYEFRPTTPAMAKAADFARRRWTGDGDIAGTNFFAYAEQGIGDTLQFCRYLPLLADRGATVLTQVQAPIRSLVAAMDPRITVLGDQASPPGQFDWQCPIMSLPLAFGTRLETIPAAVPYLRAPAERIQSWRSRLAACEGLIVGLVWAGNPDHKGDRNRSMPFAAMAKLLDLDGISFVSLQKQIPERDRESYGSARNLLRLGEDLDDFADTAGLLEAIDLIVTVDTSVAHLAGALARPVWILVSAATEWRWLRRRDDSPWYPTARVFRQTRRHDWPELLGRIAAALALKALDN
jgi:tetratricopeptide (TPR) repeat protein